MSDTFAKLGYTVVPGVLSAEQLTDIRTFLSSLYETRQKTKTGSHFAGNSAEKGDEITDCIDNCLLNYPELHEVIANPKLIASLKTLLGDDFILTPNASVLINRYNALHTDTTNVEIEGFSTHKQDDFRILTIGIYLQDSHIGGGLEVVPGSHLQQDPFVIEHQRKMKLSDSRLHRKLHKLSGKLLYAPSPNLKKAEKNLYHIPSKAGDAVVFDMRIIHRAAPIAQRRPEGNRIAIFSRCARNNQATSLYMSHLNWPPSEAKKLAHLNASLTKFGISAI